MPIRFAIIYLVSFFHLECWQASVFIIVSLWNTHEKQQKHFIEIAHNSTPDTDKESKMIQLSDKIKCRLWKILVEPLLMFVGTEFCLNFAAIYELPVGINMAASNMNIISKLEDSWAR